MQRVPSTQPAGHTAPQSTPASPPFFVLSLQLAAEQTFALQTALAQSLAWLHIAPALHPSGHPPPQSTPVSSPSRAPSEHEATHVLAFASQLIVTQSPSPPQRAPMAHGPQGPPQSTSLSP
jgi:hypothetical protein